MTRWSNFVGGDGNVRLKVAPIPTPVELACATGFVGMVKYDPATISSKIEVNNDAAVMTPPPTVVTSTCAGVPSPEVGAANVRTSPTAWPVPPAAIATAVAE